MMDTSTGITLAVVGLCFGIAIGIGISDQPEVADRPAPDPAIAVCEV